VRTRQPKLSGNSTKEERTTEREERREGERREEILEICRGSCQRIQ